MNKRDIALKVYDLLKDFERVEFEIWDEDDLIDPGGGCVTIDGEDFFFDSDGNIEQTL